MADERDPVADFLNTAPMTPAQRAQLWDTFHAARDEDDLAAQLKTVGVPSFVKAGLWDLKAHGTPTVIPMPDTGPAPVEGSALERFAAGAGEMLNPISIAEGLYGAVRHPIDTATAIGSQMLEQGRQAKQAFQEGRYSEAAGHGAAALLPVVGPAAAQVGE